MVSAPDYTPEALEILKNKRKGTYNVIKIDPAYRPAPIEHKDVFRSNFRTRKKRIEDRESHFERDATQNKEIPAVQNAELNIALSL